MESSLKNSSTFLMCNPPVVHQLQCVELNNFPSHQTVSGDLGEGRVGFGRDQQLSSTTQRLCSEASDTAGLILHSPTPHPLNPCPIIQVSGAKSKYCASPAMAIWVYSPGMRGTHQIFLLLGTQRGIHVPPSFPPFLVALLTSGCYFLGLYLFDFLLYFR